MKTLENLETSAAMMRSAFVLACNDVREEFATTNDLARRTMITAQDTMAFIPDRMDTMEKRIDNAAEDLRTVAACVGILACIALFIVAYCYVNSE